MQIPSAGIIETALDDLAEIDQKHLDKQTAELEEGLGSVSNDYAHGYELGLQVARVMLRQNTLLELKDIKASDLL